jgi:dipeptidyl aminopeptidase/acylaminoacyl peptidase
VVVTKDVVYAVGVVSDGLDPLVWFEKDLLLDIYYPEGNTDPDKAALLLVHGGSFIEASKEKDEIVEYARYFAGQGYVCFAMNYRLRDDYPPAPGILTLTPLTGSAHAAMVDVKAAVQLIRANAAFYGIDPDRIGLLGESAGAIAGVVTVVTEPEDFSTDGPGFTIPESNYPAVSPRVQAYIHLWGSADHVLLEVDPADPPIMILHGTEDDNFFTPFEAAERLHLLLEFFVIPHEFYDIEGADHGVWDAFWHGDNLKTLCLEFLDMYLLGIA